MCIPEVLLAVRHHPRTHERTAPADDPRYAVYRQWQILAKHASMDRHVVDPLLGLMFHHIQRHLRGDVIRILDLLHQLVDRNRADRNRRRVDNSLANGVDVASRR
ncbi:MAG: hypothetical protein KatS3mg105_0772 [Gemmatales bacterium]|nr:MAG: hypothetical protein KatS3mg105_0772 [Gemmatales bacterium]